VRNGEVFRGRWGWWPMTGWLERFRADGLVDYDAATDTWSLAGTAPVEADAATPRSSRS
jgi:N-acetylglucosaminyl-diphospho-decaprenol L-rhamnosyltransferase